MARRNAIRDDYDDKPVFACIENLKVAKVTAKTQKQAIALAQIKDNDITFLTGSAGTGKTFLAAQKACEALKNGDVKKIILTRPTVEAGQTMGFLPGNIDEKLGPFLAPLMDCFEDVIGKEAMEELFSEGIIQFIPIQFARGRTFKDAFIILDEAQNATKTQLKLVLTRIGENSKCVVAGDDKQIDIRKEDSCINDFPLFYDVDGIGFVKFTDKDVMRSKVVKLVLACYDNKVQAREA